MISIDEFQAGLVTFLNARLADGSITPAALQVREFNYQASDYTYPSLRVRVGPIPLGDRNGACQAVVASFDVIAYSEDSSSLEASQIAARVMRAINNKRLTVNNKQTSPVRVLQPSQPVPLTAERGWAEHVLCECDIPTTW